jgi:hypothetical protein
LPNKTFKKNLKIKGFLTHGKKKLKNIGVYLKIKKNISKNIFAYLKVDKVLYGFYSQFKIIITHF